MASLPTPIDEAYRITSAPLALGGRTFAVSLYSVHYRRTGRRIVVREGERIVFDTHNCYDLANANNLLETWIMDNTKCAHCGDLGQLDDWAQDAVSLAPICGDCARKALAVPACAAVAPPADAAELAEADGFLF